MEKKIEDYLHLYLGCETNYGTLVGVWGDECYVKREGRGTERSAISDIKLHLRLLNSITNVEAHTIYSKYFEKNFADDWNGDNGSAYFNPKKRRILAVDAIKIIEGADYETGDFMKVISIVPYLLSRHFDLFNLIESGLAISKPTTL